MPAKLHPSYLRILLLPGLLLATSFATPSVAPQLPTPPAPPAQRARVVENYGKLPLSFEANTGQTNSAVKFLSRGRGYTLFLTSDEAVLALRRQKAESRSQKEGNRQLLAVSRQVQRTTDNGPRTTDVLRMRLVGANPAAKVMGLRELPGKTNYFLGNDPKKWRASVPTYAKVRYAGLYPGIDLVYRGDPSVDGPNGPSVDGPNGPSANEQLEFDFVAAPKADPRLIQLRFGPPNRLRLAANGDLVVTTANGALAFHKPVVYQMVGGDRQPVAGEFALLEKHTVGFRLGSYDRAKALVIDPALAFSTFLGGSGGDAGNAIAVDSAGNVYVAGRTASIDFPVTPGAFQTTNHVGKGSTAFVTKLNPTGTTLVYSTYLSGSGGETANAIAVDTAGNAYVAGQTYSSDFPVTPGAFQTTNRAAANDTSNGFVTKLNPSGAALVYSTYLGGSGFQVQYPGDVANAIAVDAAGNVYVAGQTHSSDFPVTQGAFQTTNNCAGNECSNAFITKLNPAGTALVYSTYLGGSGGNRLGFSGDQGSGIATDVAGDAYVTGQAGSSDFPVTPGAYQSTNRGAANEGTNAFVTKLNPAGAALIYSTHLGGSGNDTGNAITLDSAGNVYVAGQTSSADFPVTAGAFQTTYHGSNNGPNAFVTKLNPAGAALVYSTYLGGSGGAINLMATLALWGGDVATGLAIDSSGNAYVTGSTASANFPVTQGAYQTTNNDQPPCAGGCIGGCNAFISELNSTGSALVYSTYLGGNGINPGDFVGVAEFGNGDQATALALDSSGNVYVTGSAVSYDFPVTGGAFKTTLNSQLGNAFVAKLNMSATSNAIAPTVAVTPASSTITSAKPLTVTVSVSGGSGNPTPTGTVTLASGTYASPATTLSGGSATINIPGGSLLAEPAGYLSPDELIAKYLPDTASSPTYNFSTGEASVYVVGPYISVTPSSSTLTWAQSQTQALSVAMVATGGTGNPVPTGTVTLTTGSYSSVAIALSGGSATITIPPATLTTGFNILNVNYSGDSNYAPENPAGSALVTVGAVTVSVVPSASTINSTQPLPVSITVSAGSGSPTPTGMVWVMSGSYMSAVAPLAGGSATITIPAGTLPTGVDILEADYGEGNYAGASGQASVTVTGGTPGFTITGTPVTVTAGATTGNTSTITVTPSGGFTGSVALTAAITSGPNGAQNPGNNLISFSFGSTSPVSITGAAAGTATLSITTKATGGCAQAYQKPRPIPWYTGGSAALGCMLLFGIPTRRRRWRLALGLLAVLAALMGGFLACGSNTISRCPGTPGTPTGTYTITVTGTSGSTTGTGTVTLTVQ